MNPKGTKIELEYWRRHNEKRRLNPEFRKKQRAWCKAWREKNKERIREYSRVYARDYVKLPHVYPKYIARIITRNAILSGRLKRKACEKCGVKKTEAHHPDYARPLYVKWLCKRCHRELHSRKITD